MKNKILFAAFLRVTTSVVVALAVTSIAFAQITVTNATFPAAGDTLKMAIASNPAIGISVYGPPGGNQVWDLSGLQAGTLENTVFQPASQGTMGAQVPGAELAAVSFPGPEEYYNVTTNKFELQAFYGKFYDVVPNYLAQYNPLMAKRHAPMNFFDIYQSSPFIIAGSVCIPLNDDTFECGFPPSEFPPSLIAQLAVLAGGAQAEKLRYRVDINRVDVVDAWGTMSIPGGTYNVLRLKGTQYRSVRLDGKYFPLGWLDVTAVAIQAGFQGLGIDTIFTYNFFNDVEKEPIAIVTLNNEQNAVTQVMFKNNNPEVPVELSSFTATTKGSKILLNWQTATELNNYGFEIQKKFRE